MKFKEYYKILEENPDTLDLDLNGMKVYLRWNTDTAKPFGFVNWNATFKSEGKEIPFFKNVNNSNELILGNLKQTHNQLLRELISNLNDGIVYVEKPQLIKF